MANKRKILESARKLAQKGAKEKALKEYEKLLKLDPGDAKLRLEIGDAHRRWGQIAQAIETYDLVATQYAKEGFDARAVAVYKQIVTLDADHFDAYEPLATIYERMGLMGEALSALQTAADGLNQKGDKNRALDLLRKMATIDPTNTASRMKVAELLRQEGRQDEATTEYAQTAAELERQGDLEAAGRAYVAVLEMEPDHLAATIGVTRSMMAQNAPDKAVACARRVVKLGPDEVEHYELLASALRAAGQESELSGVYQGLAELYRRRGDDDRAREITQRYVSPAELAMEAPAAAGPSIASEPIGDFGDDDLIGDDFADDEFLGNDLIEDEEAISAVDLDQPLTPSGVSIDLRDTSPLELSHEEPALELPDELEEEPEPVAATSAPPAVPAGADPEQLLAEASVYLRYGKQDRAIGHLEAVLAVEPQHRGALEKLGEACVELGDPGRAVEAWLSAAKLALQANDDATFELLRERIGEIDPEVAAELLAEAAPEAPEFSEDDTGEIEIELDLDDDLDGDELSFAAGPSEPVAPQAPAPVSANSLSTTTSQQISDDLEEADFYVQQSLFDEAAEIYKRVLSLAPSHPTALVRLGELAAARGESPDDSSGEDAIELLPSAGQSAAGALGDVAELSLDTTEELALEYSDAELPDDEPLETTESPMSVDIDAAELEVELSLSSPGLDTDPIDPITTPLIDEEPAPDFELAEAQIDFDDTVPDPEPDPEPEVVRTVAPLPSAAPPAVRASVPEPEPPAMPERLPPAPAPEAGVDLVAEIGGFEDEGPQPQDPDDSFDLAAELSDAFDDSMSGFQESQSVDDGFSAVFSAFKKGVSETLTDGDHQAHYDLGIAYKEMGLFDDAISEFHSAMQDAGRRPECLHLMGLCALDAGHPAAAVDHLKALLGCEELYPEAALAAQYDIGRAYAALGEIAQAKLAYQSVQALDPSFRDVESLIEALAAPPQPAAASGPEEAFESFDDFMGDDPDEEEAAFAEPSIPQPGPMAPRPSTGLDASALAEAAAEVQIDAPVVMADVLDDDDDDDIDDEPVAVDLEDELAPVPEFDAGDAALREEPAPEKSGSSRRRKKKISFV